MATKNVQAGTGTHHATGCLEPPSFPLIQILARSLYEPSRIGGTLRQRLGSNTSRASAERALRGVLESVKLGLRRDRQVQLIGFGTFRVAERKPRTGVNPRTGEPMAVPGGPTIKFSAGKDLKSRL